MQNSNSSYYTKILMNGGPLYVETPKCVTRQGVVQQGGGKRAIAEFVFSHLDEEFLQWIESLETRCQQLIYEKNDKWFETPIELTDIETAFLPIVKVYKGKLYLLRSNIKINGETKTPQLHIYNENQTILTLDDMNPKANLISILEIQGIRFTNKSFQIEIEVKQTMVLQNEEIFNNCLIQRPNFALGSGTTATTTQPLDTPQNTTQPTQPTQQQQDQDNNVGNNIGNNDDKKEFKENHEHVEEKQEKEEKEFKEEKEHEVEEVDVGVLDDLNPSSTSTSTSTSSLPSMKIKTPHQVYQEIYKLARAKAKEAQRVAIIAFLNAKNIKKTYLMEEDIGDETDDEEEDDVDIYNLSKYTDEELEKKIAPPLPL
jgi:hypothetical protein